jgi:hypothetical protein
MSMAFAASILPASPWDAGAKGGRSAEEIRIAQAPGTPTPAPTPQRKTLNFGGAGQN